ncbi:uncharacterized protein PV07_06174 [Cladophialophora immunda]|uniref:Zn(2)-C6 fungal-type domain-containing protein n=1 Tax=Cladophialophora immunda TaxID=569365 RepID=A0A0D1ZR02_9EURO|nr:uncharacterized protein PV07_06174 [Cladophialophora immunda]KIW30431.1 hypothetical protein PV07_06174 [Cladophialophora immunda]
MPRNPSTPLSNASNPTPGSSGTTTPRTRRACDACRQRKIKCDGATPQCDWCRHHGDICAFTRTRGSRRRRTRSSKLEETNLIERMNRIEYILTTNLRERHEFLEESGRGSPGALRPAKSESADSKSLSPEVPNPRQIYMASYKLGDVNLFHGVPYLSRSGRRWIGFRNDEDGLANINDKVPGPLWHNQHHLPRYEHLSVTKIRDLPPRQAVQSSLEAYQRSEFSNILPVIDPVLFSATIEEAYEHGPSDSYEALPQKASIFAFLAVGGLLGESDETLCSPQDIEGCEIAFQLLSSDLMRAKAGNEVVDALMMIAVYQFCCGKIHTTDIILSLASRFLFMLGAHLYPGPELDGLPVESQSLEARTVLHQRDLFWICYTLDREITFRTGRAPVIHDTSCDLTFPASYLKQISPGYNGPWRLPGDLRLSTIKSKAYEKLYSPHSRHKSDAELLKDIRELDSLLESWRLSHPAESRPTLSFSDKNNPASLPSLLIRLEYYHCVTTIHQASSRCKDWTNGHDLDGGLSSSMELALKSSRCLLSCLHSAVAILPPNLFWVILFYPLSAELILVCHILLNPSGKTALSDLTLLKQCLSFVKQRFPKPLTASGVQARQQTRIHEATEEVVQLAETAVRQSRQPDS